MLLGSILDILFPTACAGCAVQLRGGELLCAKCETDIPVHRTFFCAVCGNRIPPGNSRCHGNARYRFGAATDFSDERVRALIHALKFKHSRGAALPLARLMLRYIRNLDHPLDGYAVVPVPLGGARRRERGYDQAELLASHLAAALDMPIFKTLARTRATKPQTSCADRQERQLNMNGAFEIPSGSRAPERILLIDDVRTSGATLQAAAEALRTAGAKDIIALTVARA